MSQPTIRDRVDQLPTSTIQVLKNNTLILFKEDVLALASELDRETVLLDASNEAFRADEAIVTSIVARLLKQWDARDEEEITTSQAARELREAIDPDEEIVEFQKKANA